MEYRIVTSIVDVLFAIVLLTRKKILALAAIVALLNVEVDSPVESHVKGPFKTNVPAAFGVELTLSSIVIATFAPFVEQSTLAIVIA